jgi:putative transposase
MDVERKSRRSIRLKDFDYSQPGGYFLTIVTFQREHLFGEIVDGEMKLNDAGRIACDLWQKLPERFPTIVLDEMVVMPNHFHGTLFITDCAPVPVTAIHELPLQGPGLPPSRRPAYETPEEYRIRRRRMLLPKVVGYFKMNSAKAINLLLNSTGVPVWQRNYYEPIIRTDDELDRIRKYICLNPQQWKHDDENR